MRRLLTAVLLLSTAAWIGAEPAEQAAPAPMLTVDSIMRGPALVGSPPGAVRWSRDSQSVYFTWQRPPEQSNGDVVVLDVSKSELRSLKFEDDRRVVEVFSEKGNVWIRHTEKPVPASTQAAPATAGGEQADAGTTVAAAATPEPATPAKTREYKGNDSAAKLLERTQGIANRVSLVAPWAPDPARWTDLIHALRAG